METTRRTGKTSSPSRGARGRSPKRSANGKPRKRAKTSTAKSAGTQRPSQEQIAARAYFLWEQKGRLQGRDLEDWFEAEAQLQNLIIHF
jgi:hypothetical protein